MKLKITRVFIDKTPTQYGSFKTAIKCNEYGDRWLSGFAKKFEYKEGDEVELDVVESDKKGKDGKPYLNWKFINNEAKQQLEIANLAAQIKRIKEDVQECVDYIHAHRDGKLPSDFSAEKVDKRTEEINNEEIDPNDIPF